LDIGSERWIIKKAGAFFSYGEIKLGQGRENSREFLAKNPEVADEIEAKIRALFAK
jgi:recombination protein RecA